MKRQELEENLPTMTQAQLMDTVKTCPGMIERLENDLARPYPTCSPLMGRSGKARTVALPILPRTRQRTGICKQSSCGLFGHVQAGKDQDGRMAL